MKSQLTKQIMHGDYVTAIYTILVKNICKIKCGDNNIKSTGRNLWFRVATV